MVSGVCFQLLMRFSEPCYNVKYKNFNKCRCLMKHMLWQRWRLSSQQKRHHTWLSQLTAGRALLNLWWASFYPKWVEQTWGCVKCQDYDGITQCIQQTFFFWKCWTPGKSALCGSCSWWSQHCERHKANWSSGYKLYCSHSTSSQWWPFRSKSCLCWTLLPHWRAVQVTLAKQRLRAWPLNICHHPSCSDSLELNTTDAAEDVWAVVYTECVCQWAQPHQLSYLLHSGISCPTWLTH